MAQLNQLPFFSSRTERIALARRRYFEDGQAPTGVISDAVFQSWARCQRLHGGPNHEVVFEPVSLSRTHLALQKNRELQVAWIEELPELQTLLGTTTCAAMLTDATGVLIGATCAGRSHERVMPVATRIGVNLAEEAVGTTAPGVVARTGEPVCVLGAEHFFDDIRVMHCAAVPIRDTTGRLAGVLDVSSESIPFSFDAASVVSLYAAAIENRLLIAQSVDHLVLRFQTTPTLLDSPVAALVGIDSRGRVAWHNGVACRLLGLPRLAPGDTPPPVEPALGMQLTRLASLPASGAAVVRLPNGLMVWARCEMRARDGRANLVAMPQPNPEQTAPQAASGADSAQGGPSDGDGAVDADALPTLRASDRDVIARTIKECGGNVSLAARTLGVSRGLIYRRLREPTPA
jgi:transcriptional regulator of acetoin/glycerol metabolism